MAAKPPPFDPAAAARLTAADRRAADALWRALAPAWARDLLAARPYPTPAPAAPVSKEHSDASA